VAYVQTPEKQHVERLYTSMLQYIHDKAIVTITFLHSLDVHIKTLHFPSSEC